MSRLTFRFDWEPPDETVLARELRTTWARLEMLVSGGCVTFVEDIPTGSARRSIYVPLYPLAEWVAFNWWLLHFDGRQNGSMGAVDRRNMQCAGDGISWPNIAFRPAGDLVSVRWAPGSPLIGDLIRYLDGGQAWIESGAVRSAFGGLVHAVVGRLRECGIPDTPLQEEWARVTAVDTDQAKFCEAAARLGLDPFSEGIDHAELITRASESLPPEIRDDFFDSVELEQLQEGLSWVTRSLEKAKRADRVVQSAFELHLVLAAVRQSAQSGDGSPPWATGYAAASSVRQRLDMSPTCRLPDNLPVGIAVQREPVLGLSSVGATPRAADWTRLVVRPGPKESQRFAAARALWHAARGQEGAYLLTSASSTPQQTGRAFAAELLAPAEGIRHLLGGSTAPPAEEDLAAAAEHFGTSTWVIDHQVRNQLQYQGV